MTISHSRRGLMLGAASAVLFSRLAQAKGAEEWPTRPVKVIVPGGAGGILDALARQLYARVQESLGQPFIIDNRPGANGLVGSSVVKNAAPDGYTILHSTSSAMVMAEALNPDIRIKALTDFEPVALAAIGGVMLAVHPDVPANNLPELVALLQKNPETYQSYGSWGVGSNGHLTMEWLKQQAGLTISHVPYKTSPALLTDMMSSVIPIGWVDVVAPLPFIEQGKIRPITLTGTARSPRLPEVKLMSEQGYDFTPAGWQGVFAPKNTPTDILERLHAAINHELVQPEFVEALRQANIPSTGAASREALTQIIEQDLGVWRQVVVDGKISLEN